MEVFAYPAKAGNLTPMLYRTAAVLALLTAFGRTAELPVCPPDWSIEIVASAPQIKHPSVVCTAPDGRVFVAEDPMDISAPRADLTLGRILCFHPNGKLTVFAEKLYAVFGMQYLEGKLYVLHNPKFSVFSDNNGVGTNRFDLIESTHPNPWALDWNDHVPANFRLAMDGYFYVAVGDKGVYGAVGRDGKRVDLHGGGILRLRPDGTELEVFCTGVRNILDVAMTVEDEVFTYDNTDEMEWMSRLTHMVDGGFYGYPYDFSPRRGYTLWMMVDYGGGAATGTLCYNEDALPEEYRGNLWLADFGKRQILRVKVAREGATFQAVSREDVFSKVPNDFYPVGIAWGADAKSIYICDWQHRDTKENVVAGRLWKMAYTGPSQAARKPNWYLPAALGQRVNVPDEELVNALGHPSHSVRMTAQRRLSERGDAGIKLLRTVLQQTNGPPTAQWHAIWALNAIDQGRAARKDIISLVSQPDPSVAGQAIRQLGSGHVREGSAKLETILKHHDASIRFHAATALGRIGSPSSIEGLMRALEKADTFAAYATFTALNRIGKTHPSSWEHIARGLRSSSQVVGERTAFALRETYDEKLVIVLSNIAGDATQPVSARVAALRLLAGVHRKRPEWKGEWWAYHPVKSPPVEKSVEWKGTPVVLGSLRAALDSEDEALRLAAVEGIREAKDIQSAGTLREMFAKEKNEALKRALVEAFAALRDTNAGSLLVEFLREKNQPATMQQRAIQALGAMRFSTAAETLVRIAEAGDTNARIAAIEALVSIGGDPAVKSLEKLTTRESRDLRSRAILALGSLKNRDTFPVLLRAYAEPETRTPAIHALTQMPDLRALDAYLHGLADRNASLREKCRRALSTIHKEAWATIDARLSKLPSEAIPELQRVYKDFEPARRSQLFTLGGAVMESTEYAEFARRNSGDPDHGRKLFFDANGVACSKCHVVSGVGGTVGPDLSTAGSQFSRDVLIESVLYPSKAIREGYQQTVIELRTGDSVNGSVKGESADTLTIQDADGRLHTLRKGQIAERNSSALSLMPEGLHSALTLAEFADLIAYLETLKGDSPRR